MSVSLLSVMHVNVNCSDLARSKRFYEEHVGLAALSHTKPAPQDGAGFGLAGRVQWDAHLLHDARGFAGPAVDLLEWKTPPPVGRPYAEANHLGLYRLCFAVPDAAKKHAALAAAGVPCLSPPARVPLSSEMSVTFFCALDPDGTAVEFLEAPAASDAASAARLLHVNVNCSDLPASAAWYRRVLGLETVGTSAPGPVDGRGFGFGGKAEWRAEFLAVPGRAGDFVIDLLEWRTPRPIGRPYTEANHLGLYRLAFLVADARAACAELDRLGVAHSGPVWLEMGPEIPIDGLRAVFFRDPDGACLELIETPLRNSGV
jgi:glyoxylase I family protein